MSSISVNCEGSPLLALIEILTILWDKFAVVRTLEERHFRQVRGGVEGKAEGESEPLNFHESELESESEFLSDSTPLDLNYGTK